MNGSQLIAEERKRQVNVEHWTAEHDAKLPAQLAMAGAAYAVCAAGQLSGNTRIEPPVMWPWERRWWKPTEDPVRNLTKAGALIAAEIDRILAARAANQR